MTTILVVAVAAGLAVVVLGPVLFGTADRTSRTSEPDEKPGEVRGLRSEILDERKSQLIQELRDVEERYRLGRIGEGEYRGLKEKLELEAVAVLRELDTLKPATSQPATGAPAAGAPRAPTPPSAWPKAIGWSAAVVGFVALAWVALASQLRPRADDQPMTGRQFGNGGTGERGAAPGGMMGGLMAAMVRASGGTDTTQLERLEARLAQDSTDLEALVRTAHIRLSQQRLGDAAHLSIQALELDHRNIEAHAHVALILFSQGRSDLAMESLEQILALQPDYPEALLYKGMIQLATGGDPSAAWERFFEVAPADADTSRLANMLRAVKARVEP